MAYKNLVVVVLVVLVLVFAGLYLFDAPDERSGVVWEKESFVEGLYVGQGRATEIDRDGALAVGSNGTSIAQYRCDSVSYDPPSVSSSTAPASTTISNTGASLGDVALGSFDSSTSTDQWLVSAKVTGSGSTTLFLEGVKGAAVNLSTSTAKVCTIQ